ncbi:hypothetical protein M5J14_23660 [Lysinibacillus sp. OL1_EC]|uniref:hypothetical protein n=1 Tax=unclassified Lysinibacillus TaxID=2636778 RepID=UPI00103F0254|nr:MULTISPECIES: hypothetical protein [unclassified Lysinibacillus]MCM0627474.1 hypothetical protein [Lysinibacillus sp. OL1_EC]TBV84318.1 hypothetical protein EW028_24255 [Lysinibacillus sp. OL1]
MCSREFVNNSLEPLNQWVCDSCGEIIDGPENGWLEWYRDINGSSNYGKGKGFRIVHHDKKCMYNEHALFQQNKLTADMHLDSFVGPDGLVYLLSKIQYDSVEDNAELVEIIRRLHVPYYEEALLYHHAAEEDGYFDGENEITRYTTRTSKYILNNYKR